METLGAFCPHCNEASASPVHGTFETPEATGPPSLLSLVSCERCGEPFLLVQEEQWNHPVSPEDDTWGTPEHLWPPPRRLSLAIPELIRRELEEARKCIGVKAYRATAVMVRRTLEGFCQDQGIKEKTLHLSLKKLAEANVVDRRLLEWADGLKALGNAGAHFTGEKITAEDATDALELAEALLDYTYVFTARYEAFKERRAGAKAT